MNTESEKIAEPLCRYLRTKAMYIPALANSVLESGDESGGQTFYWCNKTQTALGIDDLPAHPCACRPGRSCHQT
ncbi:MAG TPA: hypothetical protein VL981_07705 [Candidatus Methylacidiphilales bacterium]|nr:hypothetical protein [Candidatus Methylacidiphilales bacterium]